MNSLKHFVLILGSCFIVPTYCMVAHPYAVERNRQPVPYVMEEPGSNKPFDDAAYSGLLYPSSYAGDRKRGEQIYGREGCAQCHTQVIRPDYAGIDQFKRTWGRDQAAEGIVPTRQTYMWDYLHEDFAMIGQRRVGPDLANAGYRFEGNTSGLTLPGDLQKYNEAKARGLNDFYLYLYAPRERKAWSNSPGFRHLFITRPIEGQGSASALQLPPDIAPPAGMEVVPSNEAKALADYVLGLKRDQPIPASISGAKPKPAAP